MEHAGWYIVGGIVTMALGGWLHWLFTRNNCEKCGIADLKTEIYGMSALIRELAARAGISPKEQLEIESMGKGGSIG